ncbi:hypothetical protein PSTT_07896 [Puccinia striiformis]|uniref:Uncharacterized protein n=1 Tax=Puccinia striiformis TaxID=27350 RepID=A0A2S4VEL1_9BASI|nr:hypothetical protein PSTT_07896 [Puccinia striiformis]
MGVPLSDVCFRKHQRIAELNVLLRTRPVNTEDPTPHPRPLAVEPAMPSRYVDPQHQSMTPNNRAISLNSNVAATSHITMQSATAGPSGGLNPTTSNTRERQHSDLDSEFWFLDQHVMDVLLQATRFHFDDYMSEAACERFLADEKQKLTRLGNRFGFQTSIMLRNIPASMSTVTRRLGLDCSFQEQAACPKCWTLHEAIPDSETWAKQKLHLTVTTRCTARFFSTARSLSTSNEQIRKCDEAVFKEFTVSGKPAWRPIKGFCYQKLQDWLKRKLICPEFEDLIDAPLRYTRQDGVMRIFGTAAYGTLSKSPAPILNRTQAHPATSCSVCTSTGSILTAIR